MASCEWCQHPEIDGEQQCPNGCGYFIHPNRNFSLSTWYHNYWCLNCGTKLKSRLPCKRAAKRPSKTECKQCKHNVFARNGDAIRYNNQILQFDNAKPFYGEGFDLAEEKKANSRPATAAASAPHNVFEN